MNKKQLIRSFESLHPDLTYTKDGILEIVEQLEDINVVDKGSLITTFMADVNTLWDIKDVARIIDEHTGEPVHEAVLDNILFRFEKIMSQTASKDKLITVLVTIGKSKAPIEYSFLKSDFRNIKGDQLFINNEDQRIRLYSNDDLIALRLQLS